jgi:tRNA pseudouridine13 synthase
MSAHAAALAAALLPPRAFGAAAAAARLRTEPEDFLVEELLGFEPSGSGQHLLLRVRKRNANTRWVAGELAALGGCRPGEVGYAGLKDRRALAVQWFSVPRPRTTERNAVSWLEFRHPEFEVLEAIPHSRKLPVGALAGNRFTLRLRAVDADGPRLAALMAARLELLSARGVPNYFGPQRFGRDGANLTAPAGWRTLPRSQRSFVLSAARSAVFNAVLAARVSNDSWERLVPGDIACLDGRGSIFAADPHDASLAARCAALEIHPTGPLWGEGTPPCAASTLELESRIALELGAESELCREARMRQERRSLRLAVRELHCSVEADAVLLTFRLARGGFATAVLRELLDDAAIAARNPD